MGFLCALVLRSHTAGPMVHVLAYPNGRRYVTVIRATKRLCRRSQSDFRHDHTTAAIGLNSETDPEKFRGTLWNKRESFESERSGLAFGRPEVGFLTVQISGC